MPFSEKIKKQARKLSEGQCVMCKKEIALEIHHIVPQEEGGEDTLDNAAPMCCNCHEIYGSNPTKRKLIRDLRDNWYDRVKDASNSIEKLVELHRNPDGTLDKIAIFHAVLENETFEQAASTLFGLISNTQKDFPDCKRILYLDIEGHRNNNGGFDNDMFELQCQYIIGFLGKYLSEMHMPLGSLINEKGQINDIPEKFYILSDEKSKYDFYCKDIFTKTKYICNHDLVDKRSDFIVATNLTPFVATDNKVTYKEAQQILKNMNTHLSLKI